jgi:hypothetical protein
MFLNVYDDHDVDDSDDDDDESTVGENEKVLVDDMESDDETVDDEDEDERCGTILERSWNRRSKALRTDISIAGWMCSPHAEIMEDCKANNKGEHRLAVIRLLQKWYYHRVCIFFLLQYFLIFFLTFSFVSDLV